ncbi:Rrf2 family transcriptional regulator [Paramagnetospirillum kuznetsovii]|uniref:Rrf2 family transcriptional regulator n=1 Tax=Paramagnetospirillum kuznetsovii TaxID=2053833 RepID=A0A364NV66_9PROT|nr:Rrf2 family transcriptional regulator [Paramagnetospirillum kuznetsovii]RAU20952.1 Rrf2 family transcriptional regulator [Paramagnetospirillum kuznetsovii]
MRLTLHTDYAMRVLVHVGLRNGDLVTITEIADCYGISKNHLTKVVHQLGRIGYLETVRGKYGGVRLLRQPDDIRLGDFIRDTEEDFSLVRCMRCESSAECRLSGQCIAHDALSAGLRAFFAELNRYTLADMLATQRSAAAAAAE